MKPLPIISTPDQQTRRSFLLAMKKAGIAWCGGAVTDRIVNGPISNNYAYAYVMQGYEPKSFAFTENPDDAAALLHGGRYTLVNSPAHFAAYARTV